MQVRRRWTNDVFETEHYKRVKRVQKERGKGGKKRGEEDPKEKKGDISETKCPEGQMPPGPSIGIKGKDPHSTNKEKPAGLGERPLHSAQAIDQQLENYPT